MDEQIKKFMDTLGCTEQEARELAEYDRAIDKGEKNLDYDLTVEQQKVAQTMTRTGTRKMKETGLRLTKRERKPNELKGAIISAFATFLAQTDEFSAENVEITNKERVIAFECGGERFELTLTQKRKPKN